MADPQQQPPQETKLEKSIEMVNALSPEAAKTLRSIAKAQSGDAKGAIQVLATEGPAMGSVPDYNKEINGKRTEAMQALGRGDLPGAIKAEMAMFGSQLGIDAMDKENLYRNGPIPDPDKAKAVETLVKTIAGDQNGDKAVAALDKFTDAKHNFDKDVSPGGNKFKELGDAVKANNAKKDLAGILSEAVPGMITGGDTPQGDPKAPATPAKPDAGKEPGRGGPP